MTDVRANIRHLAAALGEDLAKCADDPDVDPVHDIRTGTRRLQAILEVLIRDLPPESTGERVRTTAMALIRVLKKIRRSAGPVRDLDVHRKILSKLTKQALGEKTKNKGGSGPDGNRSDLVDNPDPLETREAGLRSAGLEGQADDLDAWLKHRRSQMAREMQAEAQNLLSKLEKRVADLEEAMHGHRRQARKKSPGRVALESFARLATEMQHLNAGNLHDFRKGAKKARYVADLAAQNDPHAKQIGEALKKLQDEIGDWHDWLLLAEEARSALGGHAADLIALIDAQREKHFVTSMKTAAKLRGRLMGEWLALSPPPPKRAPKAVTNSSRAEGRSESHAQRATA